jgi:hypothetical protein
MSLGQDPRWRRALVDFIDPHIQRERDFEARQTGVLSRAPAR